MAVLRRVDELHGYGTRSARSRLVLRSGDHRLVVYRAPAEWCTLTEEQRGMGSAGVFKRSSRGNFLWGMSFSSVGLRFAGCVGTAVRVMGILRIRGAFAIFCFLICY
jgi:hypothetical protein